MPRQSSIAKITRPRLQKVMLRKRLFSRLDLNRHIPITWVMGPGGSGKTTLVASWLDANKIPCLWYHLDEADGDIATFFYYMGLAAKKAAPHYKTPLPLLTMEYMQGSVPAFTRNYFEKLCSRLKPPFAIVLDNYHHIRPDSLFHDVIREALAVVPEGFQVMIVSRGAPPPTLSVLQAYNKINYIGWEDLKFDMNETWALLKAAQKKGLSVELLTRIQQMTLGWAAGLTLLIERLKTGSIAPEEIDRFKPDELFDYFATELFDETERGTQEFLMRTALLPRIAPSAAAELTGRTDAGAILATLSRNHFFTEQRSLGDPVYQYHPLFREFLQARAKQAYTREQMRELLRRAGEILEKEGQAEDAAELYRLSGEWKRFMQLVLANAHFMVSQGRSRTLEAWLTAVPEDIHAREPWLQYWLGVCRMPVALTEGRRYFEKSLALFKQRHDANGAFLAWSGVAESLIQELGDLRQMDPWIEVLDHLMEEFQTIPSPQIEGEVTARIFMTLSLRRPWHPAFNAWKAKALAILESDADANLRLLTAIYLFTHFIQIGDSARCAYVAGVITRLIGTGANVSPLAYVMGKTTDAWYAQTIGAYKRCLEAMSEGLEKSRESGVHLWDHLLRIMGVYAALGLGDYRQSEQLLEQMAAGLDRLRPLDKFYYYHLASLHCTSSGEIQRALVFGETAIELAQKIAFLGAEAKSRYAMAYLMQVTGKYGEAKKHIALSREIGRAVKSDIMEFYFLLALADIAFAEHDEHVGLLHLREAMALGREKGYAAFNFFKESNKELSFLCRKALEAGIEPAFAREMIRKRHLVPETPPFHIEHWPWPIRIYTLGGFRLYVDDKLVAFSGKVQKKPLEMLKILVALGEGGVRESHLTDVLWSEAEGDAASASYRTTMHRLRQMVGNEKIVIVDDGRVSLDARYCWVDAWAFERMFESLESGFQGSGLKDQKRKTAFHSPKSAVLQPLVTALSLYRGRFLAGYEDKQWSTSMRERLQGKFLHAVETLGQAWLDAGEPKKALACYARGLEIDDLAEHIYQSLMICNLKLGRKAEAVRMYERCKKSLVYSFGIEPSPRTEEIFASIRKKS
jgi:two-component SAPR family response regulator